MDLSDKKKGKSPLDHLKNALISESARRIIYFWPYSFKGRYLYVPAYAGSRIFANANARSLHHTIRRRTRAWVHYARLGS